MKRVVGAALFLLTATAGCRRVTNVVPPARRDVESDDVASRGASAARPGPRVIWIGLDGLDWEYLDRLAGEGVMPNWTRLVHEGFSARLRSFMPILSPVVWTTIATGVAPDVHRVLDFQEVDPSTGEKLPISGFSRAVPAVWNLASSAGRRVGVVGWWATHPAEQVNGFFVTDRATPILFSPTASQGVAYPPELAGTVSSVLARDGVIAAADLERYVSLSGEEIARRLGGPPEDSVAALARILSATRVTQRLARELYDRERPELTAVYFEGTDEIGHVFAPFAPPKMSCTSKEDFVRFGATSREYFRLVDSLLGQWMRRAREDRALLLVNSDHGFKWSADRPCERSSRQQATAAYWHHLDGVLAAWGEGIAPAAARAEASVFDLAPTVLGALHLPADRRMQGRAISSIAGPSPVAKEDLFSRVEVHRVSAQAGTDSSASEYARKLRALGYLSGSEATARLSPPGGTRPGMTEGAYNNLGLYERETAHRPAAAEADFREALRLRPGYPSPMFNLAVLERSAGRDSQAIDWLGRSIAAGHPDPDGTILLWAAEYRQAGKAQWQRQVLELGRRLLAQSEPVARALADLRFHDRDCERAYSELAGFEAVTRQPETLNELALLQTCRGKRAEAIALFERSLAMRPEQPPVREAIAVFRGRASAGR
jgi:predicted AlkP superfamily phosphohydrolase/phosphomutase